MAQIKYITKNTPDSGYTEKYHDDNAIRDEIQYIFDVKHGGEKTDGYRYIGGWAVDSNIAAYEMELLARLYHKWSGVRLRHWTITFAEWELQAAAKKLPGLNRWQILQQLAYEFTAYYADRYQVVFAVHGDHGAGHIHVVMNTVGYTDGLKFVSLNCSQKALVETPGRNQVYLYTEGIFQIQQERGQMKTMGSALVNSQVNIAGDGDITTGVGSKQIDPLNTVFSS